MEKNQQRDMNDSRKIVHKTDRNAVLLAIILAAQTLGVTLIERNYQERNKTECAKIGFVNESD